MRLPRIVSLHETVGSNLTNDYNLSQKCLRAPLQLYHEAVDAASCRKARANGFFVMTSRRITTSQPQPAIRSRCILIRSSSRYICIILHAAQARGDRRMMLTLYYAPMTCALVPYVTLTEAGADFDVQNVNTRGGQNHSPEFLRINPKHKVPVLVIDGEALTENVAIQIWISRHYPAARLLPLEPRDEIKAISLMAWCASGIHPHLTPNARPQNYCDLPGSEENVKRVANRLLCEDFTIADGMLNGREWFFAHFTAVDA